MEHAFTEHRYDVKINYWGETWILQPFGDVHRFAQNCDELAWKSFLSYCKKLHKDYNGRIIYLGMGDYDDFLSFSERHAIQTSKLHDTTIQSLDDIAQKRTYDFIKEIDFMKGKVIGFIEGNHHYKFSAGISSTQKMCEYFNCRYLGINTWIKLSFATYADGTKVRSSSLDIFAHHGTGGGRRSGSSINSVEDMMRVAEADIYIMGDDHKRWVVPVTRFKATYGNKTFRVRERNVYLVRSGSFQKGYVNDVDSYITRRALPPVNLGAVTLKLTPKRHFLKEGRKKPEELFTEIRAEL